MHRLIPFLCVLLVGCAGRTGLTTAQRDRLHFDAHRPAPGIELPRSRFAVPVEEEEGSTNFPADFPAVATFRFTVVGSPRSFGLWRSFDGGDGERADVLQLRGPMAGGLRDDDDVYKCVLSGRVSEQLHDDFAGAAATGVPDL